MNSLSSSFIHSNTDQLLLCPQCNFRISIINNYSSSNSSHSSNLSFNTTCSNDNHNHFPINYINKFKSNIQFCTNHPETIGKYSCIKCNLFFCENCALAHEKENKRHVLTLHSIKTNKTKNNNNKEEEKNYKKEKLLEIKKKQLKQIENIVTQLINVKDAVQMEIHQILSEEKK